MERSDELKDFIRAHSEMFWYSPGDKGETVSDELLVESVINYGTLTELKTMFDIVGLQKLASIFRGMEGRKKANIYPELRNYFELFFNKYAP